jgi:hypothetical protein
VFIAVQHRVSPDLASTAQTAMMLGMRIGSRIVAASAAHPA